MILTNHVLSIISSFSAKKIQSKLLTNKQPSLKRRVSCAIQNGSKLRHSNLVSSDAKKAKATPRTRLSGNTITQNYIDR